MPHYAKKYPTSIHVDVQQEELFRTYAKALPLNGVGGNIGYVLFNGEKARVVFLYPPLIRKICDSENDIEFKLYLQNHNVSVQEENSIVDSCTGKPIVHIRDLDGFLAPYGWSKPDFPKNVYELLFPASSFIIFESTKIGAEGCVEKLRNDKSYEYEFPAREELVKEIPIRNGLPRSRPTDLHPYISWPKQEDMIWSEKIKFMHNNEELYKISGL